VLIPTKDASAIVEAVTTLYEDSNLRQALVSNALLRIDDFSVGRMLDAYETLYRTLPSR